MKIISKQDLILRDSFALPFAGGEIWCTELDSLSIHTDVAKKKFLKDMETIRKPSSPAFISINLTDTLVDSALAGLIVNALYTLSKPILKVAVTGLDRTGTGLFKALLKKQAGAIPCNFFTDVEKAKEWLIINKI
jgi:hypothetical protein